MPRQRVSRVFLIPRSGEGSQETVLAEVSDVADIAVLHEANGKQT